MQKEEANQKEISNKTDIVGVQINLMCFMYQLVKDLRNKIENTNPKRFRWEYRSIY